MSTIGSTAQMFTGSTSALLLLLLFFVYQLLFISENIVAVIKTRVGSGDNFCGLHSGFIYYFSRHKFSFQILLFRKIQ